MSGMFLGGLVSGMSTNDVIQQLLQLETNKLRVQESRRAQVTARQNAWRDIESSLSRLQSRMDALRMPSNYEARKATVSNTAVAAVTVGPDALTVSHKLKVERLASTHVVAGARVSDPNQPLNGGSLTINGKKIELSEDATLYTLRDQINEADANVRADLVKVMNGTNVEYQLMLTSKQSGTDGVISFTSGDGTEDDLAEALGLISADGKLNTITAGQDALFELNGVQMNWQSNTLTGIMPGISITLQEVGETGITISEDPDKLLTAVQELVDALNSSLTLLADRSRMEPGSSNNGPLAGDSMVRRLQSTLRSMLSTQLEGLPAGFRTLADVGVKTGAFGTANYGRITFDKEQFRQKLLDNPLAVAQLFGARRQNVALTAAVEAGPGSGKELIVSGNRDTTRAGWVAPWVEGEEISAALTLAGAKRIDGVTLTIPDTDGKTGIQSYQLFYQPFAGGDWVPLADPVTEHKGSTRTFSFNPVEAYGVKLVVNGTYGNTDVRVTQLEVFETADGLVPRLGAFLRESLASSSGSIAVRQDALSTQIKNVNRQMDRINEQIDAQEKRLRQQFANMERMMAQLQSQGNAFSAQFSSMLNQTQPRR